MSHDPVQHQPIKTGARGTVVEGIGCSGDTLMCFVLSVAGAAVSSCFPALGPPVKGSHVALSFLHVAWIQTLVEPLAAKPGAAKGHSVAASLGCSLL